jgi:hypothetical protein
MALLVTSAGTPLAVHIESITYDEKIDDPATCAFDVPDSVAYSLSQYQVVQVTDTVTSILLYAGYIVSVADTAFPGNLGIRMRTITCTGNRWLAEKRYWTGPEFDGWTAGDVAAEVHRVVLAAEGVTAAYALRHDMDAASFGAGTLVGTSAAGGTLTLASAGSDFTQTETSAADFNSGTLTNIGGLAGQLALTSYLAIKYSGSAGANLDNNNLYSYRKIWAGSAYTLVALDEIYVDQWVDSRSPEIKAGIDLLFSDGSWMHDYSTDFQDREVIPLDPATDLKGWADDQWYSRKCIVPATRAGLVVVAVYLVFQGEKGGDYSAYFKNIKITNSGGATLRRSIFSGTDTTMAANVKASSNGYYNTAASVVTAYAESGSRVSPARSITGVGIVSSSIINWTETDTLQPTGATNTYPPQVLIEASVDDGATYQTCTNHAPIPGLIAGMNTSGRTVTLRETLSIGGPDPTRAPTLSILSFTVYSAAAATKSDFVDIDNSAATLGTGVLTNCTAYSDGVKTTGIYHNWDDLDFSNQTLFGVSGAGNPAQGAQTGYFYLRTDGGLDCKSRFDFAGTWQNFIAEIDIHIVSSGGGNEYEFVYRETSWVNANNTYAYAVGLTASTVSLRRASNGGAASFFVISSVSLSLTVGAWYRMKVVVNGSNHLVFINDAQFINSTDSTYTAAGNVGVRFWNGSGVRDSAHFDNFGIVGWEADLISVSSRTTAAIALSGIVGDSRVNWQADIPSSSGLVVESTLNNGTLWEACTNGGQIPQLVAGYNAAGKSLKFRFSMTNQAINLPVALQGYSAFVIGQYSASGTRVSPVLLLDPVGTQIGSSSISWVDSAPPGTTVGIDSSTDNITYSNQPASGLAVQAAGINQQGSLVADDFGANTAANYTATFWTGGVLPVFTIDTANTRMRVTSGSSGLILWTTGLFPAAADISFEAITNQSEAGGFVWRYVDTSNLYYLTLRDNSAAASPNTVTIRKRQFAADNPVTSPTTLPVLFTRGTYHTLKLTMIGSVITVLFDGIVVNTVTDTTLVAAGQVGLRQNSGVETDWYSIAAQKLGGTAIGKTLYTRTRLASTDPTVKPFVSSLVASVRSPDIMTGVLINATDYAYKKKCSEVLLDVAGQSKMYVRIDKNKKLLMKDRAYSTAPWPLYSADPLFLGSRNPPTATRQSPAYRNRQYVYNCVDLQSIPESKVGDGTAQSWPLAYQVDSITSLLLDGDPQTVGVQGVDSGKDFYYQPGQAGFSQDSSGTPPDRTQTIALVYVARVPYTSMRENTAQQAILAAVDGTSGIVEASEDGGGISAAAGDVIAQARIDVNAILSLDWEYFTSRPGLQPGQLQTMFVPEHGLNDVDMLISEISTFLWLDGDGNLQYEYDVKATSGPSVGNWQRIFAQA